MQIDLSLTITSIIALCAIISPIITTAINNHHQSAMKKIEFYELAKRESLNKFINSFALYFHNPKNAKIKEDAISSMHSLLIYFTIDKTLQLLILEAFNQKKNKLLNQAIIELSKQIEKK